MSSHKNLHFFNKSGDSLNLNYNESTQLFEGSLLFDENSTDTFKTYALYTLEKVPTFDFESIGDMGTNKFQLFNEFGIHFYGSKTNKSQRITNIEPVNNDSTFYSKWIYGEDFEVKFPVGSLVTFDNNFLEFTNIDKSFVVLDSKKNAIMIISTVDNSTFETTYYTEYTNPQLYTDKFLSSVDAIGVYNYIDTEYVNNISEWSEPNFYDKLYVGKKLNIINTDFNDGTYTIENPEITDIISFEYSLNKFSLPNNSDLIIEVKLSTDLPKLYDGGLTIDNGRVYIDNLIEFPNILKSGEVFKIVGSSYNQNFLTVKDRIDFESNNNITYYNISDQVIYKGKLYECILGYTHSHGIEDTYYITPKNDTIHWSNPTHIKVNEPTTDEILLYSQLYLTTDRYYYTQSGTQSSITMASIAEKYRDEFKLFNIDIYYENNYLKADLIYPSKYATVNFYHTQIGETYSIGSETKTFERLIGVKEVLQQELNYDLSERYKYNIVFTDLDEYGLKIIINKQVYEEEIAFIYSGSTIDMVRTIDKTLRNWLTRNYLELYKLGINVELQYTQTSSNTNIMFLNSILIVTEYPNVPIIINEIKVGTTANSYIEHSRVLFNDLGPSLNININNRDYIIQTEVGTQSNVNIISTLNKWNDLYSEDLLEYGIITEVKNNLLLFNIRQTENRLDYIISTGKINLPGIEDYKIIKKMKGNDGVLIASNEVILTATSSTSFEDAGFATGMVFSINNTYYPYVNQEYTINYLDPKVLNLSYQGPFWDVNNFICNKSPFVTIAFSLGFGQTACDFDTLNGTSGQFNVEMFDNEFNINFLPNTYTSYSYTGVSGMVDIKYIELSNCIYVFGDNSIGVIDSYYGLPITTIDLIGNTQSIKMEYNIVNNYVYCLSKNSINIFDPLTNYLISTILLTYNAFDLSINNDNGDIYITYDNLTEIHIFRYDNLSSVPSYTITTSSYNGKIVYNDYESDIYVTSTSDIVNRINGDTRLILATFSIPGLLPNIFYEPVNKSIYVYGDNVYIIDNGQVTQSDLPTSTSADLIFNNLTGELNISDLSNNFTRISTTGSLIDYTDVSHHGYIGLNPYDGSLYLSSTNNNIVVIDTLTNTFIPNVQLATTTKLTYNPDKKSMWFIQPSTNKVVEIEVQLNNNVIVTDVESYSVEYNQYGTLHPDYIPRVDIWLKSRDYFRRPRENFNSDIKVKYYWKWLADNAPEFFLYDYSGEQLKLSDNIYKNSASYSYTGIEPLSPVVLNKHPNDDLTKVNYPEYQKTIFDKIEYTLSYIDDDVDISNNIEPLQLFVGFQSKDEGALRSILQLYKKEDVSFNIVSNQSQYITMETVYLDGDKIGQIKLNTNSTDIFTDKGLKVGQHIVIYVKDSTNSKDQYISHNNASMFIIREIYTRTILVDFFDVNDVIDLETTIINNHPKNGDTTYLNFGIKVKDKEIGRFYTYGQTEEEDIRFKIELGNVGKLIDTNDVFIFKQYDILEGGIDWTFLNRKRKEMMMMKHLIYPYIGSYKSIINAINFFGYNDLQLNEYYRNVDTTSSNFTKLFKIEIPDIFDNTVEGWTENDFIKNTMPNDNFEATNLFNLTYFITDRDGTNILTYSLDEVIIKLQGLKYWLKKNIIPLTHKILDITGRVYLNSGSQIQHKVNDVRIVKINENMTPISFKMNEVYLMPVNSGSTVYNCVLDFYSIIPNIGSDKDPLGLVTLPKPYNGVLINLPDYFNIRIRTYKTYKEWMPFDIYNIGDRITYYGVLYESVINDNKANNPRKYELIEKWNSNDKYSLTSIVEYNSHIYVLSGQVNGRGLSLGQPFESTSINPYLDINWLDITEWKIINWDPVQTISEFRNGSDLLPFNFTLDSNIDPFVVIEVTSDNGYGAIYSDKKNYEIRGLKDLLEPYKPIESIGPFSPIKIR